jgi:hypothetical protein
MAALAPFLLPLLLLFGYALALFLVASAFRRGLAGWRIGGVLAIPAVAGPGLALLLAALHPSESLELVPRIVRGGLTAGGVYGLDPAWSLPIAVADVLLAMAVGEALVELAPLMVSSAAAWVRRWDDSKGTKRVMLLSDTVRALALLTATGIVLFGSSYTASYLEARGSGLAGIVAIYELQGSPTSIAMLDSRNGYVTYGEGTIAHFELPTGPNGTFKEQTVADGIVFPRGLAIVDSTLYVSDLGPLPCANPYPICRFSTPEEELSLLKGSHARVLSFEIAQDGSLANRQVVLDQLPVISTEHAPNDIVLGPDMRLYLAIGGPDVMAPHPEVLRNATHPNLDLLGTVVRFRPDGSELEVFARGIRNVYDLTFDDQGRLYGVENDGPSARGFEHEGILQIGEGADFGFPSGGTFDPSPAAKSRPFYLLDNESGSAGLEWAGNVGLGPGLLVGTLGRVLYVSVQRDQQGAYVDSDVATQVILDGLQGFVPVVRAMPDRKLLVGVFGAFRGYRNALIELEVTPPAS